MHAAAIKILQNAIEETYRSIGQYDSTSRDTMAEADSDVEAMEQQVAGLKYAISLLKG